MLLVIKIYSIQVLSSRPWLTVFAGNITRNAVLNTTCHPSVNGAFISIGSPLIIVLSYEYSSEKKNIEFEASPMPHGRRGALCRI